MSELRVIIAGGRDFSNYELLKRKVLSILCQYKGDRSREIYIVSGTARGADTLGERFASEYKLPVYRFPANWEEHGRAAGFIRNQTMANFACADGNAGMLIAFWNKKSHGTKNMIENANRCGLEVHVINY